MNKFLKSLVALSVTSTLSVGVCHSATYQVIDKGAADILKSTFSIRENNSGEMVLSGEEVYNFPI